MTRWVSLDPDWKLQDVQAGLNVIIAFLCAGAIFVLVRWYWLLAARRVAQKKDVPAYSLLSLNTVGETVDVIYLLRGEIFSGRYTGLLVQCIFVMLLTAATLISGFIARYSTRYGIVTQDRLINGSIAERFAGSIPYAEVDTNLTLQKLVNAKFPHDQLLEYLPNNDNDWEYDKAQWNSSWHMDCSFENSVDIPNPYTTGNCSSTSGIWDEFTPLWDNWDEFGDQWWVDWSSWRNNFTTYRDVLIFAHGVQWLASDEARDMWTEFNVQTIATHLYGVPYNTSLDDGYCNFAEGKIVKASYSSFKCKLTRSLGDRSVDDLYWGAFPDAYVLDTQTSAYLQHYANDMRKNSIRNVDYTLMSGEALTSFWQAYMITKDASVNKFVQRHIKVHIRVAQISFSTLVVCSVAAFVVLFGLFYYWGFLWRHWHSLDKTPQSKLDWMLQTLRKENESHSEIRNKLRNIMASGTAKNEEVPLTNVALPNSHEPDLKSMNSVTSSFRSPDIERADDGYETSNLSANAGGRTRPSTWHSQQYERVGGPHRQSLQGFSYQNRDYNPVQQQSPYPYSGVNHVDTEYDPGRR